MILMKVILIPTLKNHLNWCLLLLLLREKMAAELVELVMVLEDLLTSVKRRRRIVKEKDLCWWRWMNGHERDGTVRVF